MKIRHLVVRAAATLAVALGALSLAGAAYGADLVRETRAVSGPFSALRVAGPFDVTLMQGPVAAVVVEAPKETLDRIKVEVKDGVLVVGGAPSGWVIQLGWSRQDAARVYVTVPTLTRIAIEGSGDVSSSAWTTPGDLEMVLTGSGDLHIATLSARHASVRISGSGDVKLDGVVAEQEVKITGSGDYAAAGLKSNAASVAIAGSGDAVVWATQALSLRVSGSGDIHYYGQPTVSKSVAGSGDVIAMGDKR